MPNRTSQSGQRSSPRSKGFALHRIRLLRTRSQTFSQQKQIGICAKDNFVGKFVEEWKAYLDSSGKTDSFETVDVSANLAGILASKDQTEIVLLSRSQSWWRLMPLTGAAKRRCQNVLSPHELVRRRNGRSSGERSKDHSRKIGFQSRTTARIRFDLEKL